MPPVIVSLNRPFRLRPQWFRWRIGRVGFNRPTPRWRVVRGTGEPCRSFLATPRRSKQTRHDPEVFSSRVSRAAAGRPDRPTVWKALDTGSLLRFVEG